MTLFQIVLIVVVAFMSLIIAILYIMVLYAMVRDIKRSNAMAFQYIAQVKRDLATLIQANTKQVRCSEALTKQLNNLEDATRQQPQRKRHPKRINP